MKKIIASLFSISLVASGFSDNIQDYQKDTDAIWSTGGGAEEGIFNAISTSMLGWGLGGSAVIAVVASVLHQSTAGHAHVDCD